jgi:hypothetical protein
MQAPRHVRNLLAFASNIKLRAIRLLRGVAVILAVGLLTESHREENPLPTTPPPTTLPPKQYE